MKKNYLSKVNRIILCVIMLVSIVLFCYGVLGADAKLVVAETNNGVQTRQSFTPVQLMDINQPYRLLSSNIFSLLRIATFNILGL